MDKKQFKRLIRFVFGKESFHRDDIEAFFDELDEDLSGTVTLSQLKIELRERRVEHDKSRKIGPALLGSRS